MKNLIKLEDLFFGLLALYLFLQLNYAWWWFVVLFLAPDLSMLGYLGGSRVGAFLLYNLVHHKAVAIGLYILGAVVGIQLWQLIGLLLLAHSSIDRVFGYGLKHTDSFQHTHLGMVGKAAKTSELV